MSKSPPVLARAKKQRAAKLQPGTIVSFTRLQHPLPEVGNGPRTVGLIRLQDGRTILTPLLIEEPVIGQEVLPRMRLQGITETGLRRYDIAYEAAAMKPVTAPTFPGYILALTGPSGVGKSTISRMLVSMCSEFVAPVPILTTRGAKDGDDGEYTYVSKGEFAALQSSHEIVAVTEIPSRSEVRRYGYRAADIEAIWKAGKIPVVITEMHLLQDLARHYGRRSILSCGLLPPGRSKRAMLSHLLHRLRSRGRDTEAHIKDRLRNAEADLQFFTDRRDLFDHIIVNENLENVISALKQRVPGLAEA